MQSSLLCDAVAQVVFAGLPAQSGLDPADIAPLLTSPPDSALGDLAFPCFRLAKTLRKAPAAIACDVAASIPTTGLIERAEASGPYVNVHLNRGRMAHLVLQPLTGELSEPPVRHKGRVMVEYSQPNTHKAFHVGHMRNLSLGDAIVRLLRTDGHDVVAANYLGDVGTHIATCLWWYLDMLSDAERTPPKTARGEWLGGLYSAATQQLSTWKDQATAGDTQAAAAFAQGRARTTAILQGLEARDPELTAIWRETRQWSLDEFDEVYRWCMVKFDRVFFESEVDELGLRVVDKFLAKGVFVQSEGSIGVYNDEVKHMPFFMLRKRDGTSLYATKDLALAHLKFEEHAIDRSIYVVDSRQSDHFRHVFLTLAKMDFPQAEQCEHVPYEMVELASGAMATRKGNVILFRALRERMLAHLHATYLDKYRGDWPQSEIDEVAHYLALGAIKYGMLKQDVNQRIVFDLEAWLNLDGNTGPYLQYTAARVGSIRRKVADAGKALDLAALDDVARAQAIFDQLTQPEERDLVMTLADLHTALHQAAQALRPAVFCTYLHTLSKAINRFVTARNCHVLHSEGDVFTARIALVTAAHEAMRFGLWRLGIPAPRRM